MSPGLVRTIMDKKLGEVLTTSEKQAIYTWKSEPKGKIRCTGACAKAWPPVLVKKGVVIPMHYSGIKGDFGTIRRPDGSRQLTLDRRALYTYAHEKPGQVLCNNVDNWFAVKIRP
jgi:predicted lipoprotein with Yx(FWY)xxD motif